jgi:hypothetical protein
VTGGQSADRERRLGEQAAKRLIEWAWETLHSTAMDEQKGPAGAVDPLAVIRAARDQLDGYLAHASPPASQESRRSR